MRERRENTESSRGRTERRGTQPERMGWGPEREESEEVESMVSYFPSNKRGRIFAAEDHGVWIIKG